MIITLVACGPGQPPTRATAERLCAQEAREADGISGSIGIGGGSEGPVAGGNITITSRILNPQSEAEALSACVDRRLNIGLRPRQGGSVGITLGGST